MPDQRIESLVPADDVKMRLWVVRGQSSNVVRNMEVQRILPVAGYFDVFAILAERLQCLRQFDRHFGLIGTDANQDLERVPLEQFQVLWLHVLEIDEDVVSRLSSRCFHISVTHCPLSPRSHPDKALIGVESPDQCLIFRCCMQRCHCRVLIGI